MEPGGHGQEIQPSSESIVIEGPAFLEEGESFYNQPPFKDIVAGAIKDGNAQDLNVFSILTSLGQRFQNPTGESESPDVYKARREKFIKAKIARSTPDEEQEDTGRAIAQVLQTLEIFPNWIEYLQQKFDKGRYDFNGKPLEEGRKTSKNTTRIPSYGQWFTQRQIRGGRVQSAALGEIIADAPSSLPRKWEIRKNRVTQRFG